jgi:dTMP kinase
LAARVPEVVLAALQGLDDELSWQLREQLAVDHPRAVARTLGVSGASERTWALRHELLEAAPNEVLGSLAGADDDAAWALRERLFELHPHAVVASLSRLSSERAWALRDTWYQRVGGLSQDYESARLGLKSVTGLDDPRAWKWRKQGREIAPIAALASVRDVFSEKSWKWRHRFIRWAPKTVMATLRRVRAPESWPLREQVADDCKEALDSIQGLADEEAWLLRDAQRDRWTSTVLKSLGPLADSPRGQDLLGRQLQRYPDNLSVLQHASAIFLGAHRRVFSDEE